MWFLQNTGQKIVAQLPWLPIGWSLVVPQKVFGWLHSTYCMTQKDSSWVSPRVQCPISTNHQKQWGESKKSACPWYCLSYCQLPSILSSSMSQAACGSSVDSTSTNLSGVWVHTVFPGSHTVLLSWDFCCVREEIWEKLAEWSEKSSFLLSLLQANGKISY